MSTAYPHLFTPLQVGTMKLSNRLVATPHAALIGALWGPSEADADRNIAYWVERARHGMSWMGGISAALENNLIPGFEPTGVGARIHGVFRQPFFHDRMRRMTGQLHAYDCYATAQVIIQGGMPHGPSAGTTSYVANQVSHALTRDEIAWFIDEYAYSAGAAKKSGLDGIELHANHDDLLEWFMSPSANFRTDEYGGDFEGRMRYVVDALAAIRSEVGADFTVGMRLNAYEHLVEGYGVDEGIRIAQYLAGTGHLDYISLAFGDNWGAPSYIQTHHYPSAGWRGIARRFTEALSIPVIYGGLVRTPEVAEDVLAAGDADVIGMARAWIADPEFVEKARTARSQEIRPCIGCNECIHRRLVEGLDFACAVNPMAAREIDGPLPPTDQPQRILVIGGGPAGMEAAGLLAERGHDVTLWEAGDRLGGQLLVAGRTKEDAAYLEYADWQTDRLARAGVEVVLGRRADLDSVAEFAADHVVVATGSTGRIPPIAGADDDFVHEARAVIENPDLASGSVAVIALEDHMQPLTVAGFLADQGHDVHLVYQTPGPAPLVGKYSIGAPLAKLSEAGARYTFMERVLRIEPGRLLTQNVFSDVPGEVTGFDSVVIAAGGTPNSDLYEELVAAGIANVHILGDAYAPRRITFATMQALALSQLI